MTDAILLASIFGPLLFFVGLWMLLFHDNLVKVMTGVRGSPTAFWLIGFINLFLGLVIINFYNRWVGDRTILVTILGWYMFVRGILALFFPRSLMIMVVQNPNVIKATGIVPLIWGILLCWVAFFST